MSQIPKLKWQTQDSYQQSWIWECLFSWGLLGNITYLIILYPRDSLLSPHTFSKSYCEPNRSSALSHIRGDWRQGHLRRKHWEPVSHIHFPCAVPLIPSEHQWARCPPVLLIRKQVESLVFQSHRARTQQVLPGNPDLSEAKDMFSIPQSLDHLESNKCKLFKFSLSITSEQHLNILRNIFNGFATNIIFQLTEINTTQTFPYGQGSHQWLVHSVASVFIAQLC